MLDLTRVLAGPAATRLLAGWGAQVLRIDPPDRAEPGLDSEMTLGKACARLDLRTTEGRERLVELLAGADVFVQGYRPGALDGLGLGALARRRIRPGLVDVALDAYGWTGPWYGRRGFDSLVQMSSGIAHPGSDGAPVPLPVQALDHATGYLMATAAVRGVAERLRTGIGSTWRASLARTGALLEQARTQADTTDSAEITFARATREQTHWGPALRLPGPVRVGAAGLAFSRPAGPFGSAAAAWTSAGE